MGSNPPSEIKALSNETEVRSNGIKVRSNGIKVRFNRMKLRSNGTQVMIQWHFCPECPSNTSLLGNVEKDDVWPYSETFLDNYIWKQWSLLFVLGLDYPTAANYSITILSSRCWGHPEVFLKISSSRNSVGDGKFSLQFQAVACLKLFLISWSI